MNTRTTQKGQDMALELTKSQRWALVSMADHYGQGHSGRGGHRESTMVVLLSRGLVERVKVSTWDTNYRLTEEGFKVAKDLGASK